jgi:TonB family protein
MRFGIIISAAIISCALVAAQDRRHSAPPPTQFEIGTHTFFDVGPPFDFYDVFVVRPRDNGSSVMRISLTPPGNECFAPAEMRIKSAFIAESVANLFGSTNPCTIPEKELKHEQKRCKGCLVFSGANVVMQVRCGAQTRLIRSDILDRDWFASTPNTPEHTSWTMLLLGKLNNSLGPGPMDKPIFTIPKEGQQPPENLDREIIREVNEGKFDVLFQGAPDKPSVLYLAAQISPPVPAISLKTSLPGEPEVFVKPVYPMIARMTQVEGDVSIKFEIDAEGAVNNVEYVSGPGMLVQPVKDAASKWRFSQADSKKTGQATIEFVLNCPKKTN